MAVGYRVNSKRGIEFRRWSNKVLNENTSVGISDISGNHRPAKLYNLDVILSVDYRVNSRKGIMFRRWANKVLKDYLIQGNVVVS